MFWPSRACNTEKQLSGPAPVTGIWLMSHDEEAFSSFLHSTCLNSHYAYACVWLTALACCACTASLNCSRAWNWLFLVNVMIFSTEPNLLKIYKQTIDKLNPTGLSSVEPVVACVQLFVTSITCNNDKELRCSKEPTVSQNKLKNISIWLRLHTGPECKQYWPEGFVRRKLTGSSCLQQVQTRITFLLHMKSSVNSSNSFAYFDDYMHVFYLMLTTLNVWCGSFYRLHRSVRTLSHGRTQGFPAEHDPASTDSPSSHSAPSAMCSPGKRHAHPIRTPSITLW